MPRSAHSSGTAGVPFGSARPWLWALACLPAALYAQNLTREGNRWVETITASAPPASRLRVRTQGPVHVEAGSGNEISYTAKLGIEVHSQEDARRILSRYVLRVLSAGDQFVLNVPDGPVVTNLSIRAPRLRSASITNADGSVEVTGIDGELEVYSGAGDLKCDRVRGDCRLTTGGGAIQVGEVDGDLRAVSAGGRITVKTVRGDAVLQTAGGDVEVSEAGADLRAETAAGAIRIHEAAGDVLASTAGGSIVVGKAGGTVTARNVAGPVEVGAAAGVRCESGSGAIHVSNIAGPMRLSTAFGSIFANLMQARFRDSFLETGNGDVTIFIPSNVGVTVDGMSRRVVSDYPGVAVRMRGPEMVAQGEVNGGGPLLQVTGMGGTIFIKRQ
jgi:DUF4097 and DUF4098 domain-containing protein YvlB